MKQILKTVISMTLITALFVCRLAVYAGDDDGRLFGEGGGRGFGSNGNGRAGTIWDAYTVNVVEVFGIPVIRWEKKEKGTTPQEQEQSITRNNTFIAQMQQEYGTASVDADGSIIIKIPFYRYNTTSIIGWDNIYGNPEFFDNNRWKGHVSLTRNIARADLQYNTDPYMPYMTCLTEYIMIAPVTAYYKLKNIGYRNAYHRTNTGEELYYDPYKDLDSSSNIDLMGRLVTSGDNIEVVYVWSRCFLYGSAWWVEFPAYLEIECIPTDQVVINSYNNIVNNTTSRVGTVEANYGYIDTVTGDKILYENCTIINEQTNVYTNPVTGETQQYQDIQYDYLTRTYTLTKPDGTVITVEYGENGVVIIEGDTIYNIYYIIMEDDREGQDPDPSPTPSPSPNDPSPSPPPNGDDDEEDGILDKLWDLITGGLGQALKAIGGLIVAVAGAVIDVITGLFGKAAEGLGAFVSLITNALIHIPGLFAGFTSFLSAVFVFMPSEFIMVITFGMVLIVVAAVLRKFLG